MLQQFLNHIKHHRLLNPSDVVLLAVSGGMDSMVMLDLFKKADLNFAVAHCNFQLRGKDSDDDELFVREVCKKLPVTCYVQRFATETFALKNKLSIQMAARELRYTWFQEIVKTYAFDFLATAHHFDDSMETILLNMTKGSSIDRLTGIPLRNENIIRPMLFATRAQIETYASDKNITWREDQSNLTDDYQRNFIRHHIVPKLKEINPSLEITWQQGIDKLKGDVELLHQAFHEWKKKFISETTDRIVIDKKAFESYSSGASILWRYIKAYGFNFEQASEIILALDGQPGKHFLSSSHLLVIDRDTLIITTHTQEWHATVIDKEDDETTLGPWKLLLSAGDTRVLPAGGMFASLDADLLRFPLTWRKWKHGDFFQPLGMVHTKKLSDFFIDNKLSIVDKNLITVLESAGTIVYVVGWRIDDRFKITDRTKRVLNIVVEKV